MKKSIKLSNKIIIIVNEYTIWIGKIQILRLTHYEDDKYSVNAWYPNYHTTVELMKMNIFEFLTWLDNQFE